MRETLTLSAHPGLLFLLIFLFYCRHKIYNCYRKRCPDLRWTKTLPFYLIGLFLCVYRGAFPVNNKKTWRVIAFEEGRKLLEGWTTQTWALLTRSLNEKVRGNVGHTSVHDNGWGWSGLSLVFFVPVTSHEKGTAVVVETKSLFR